MNLAQSRSTLLVSSSKNKSSATNHATTTTTATTACCIITGSTIRYIFLLLCTIFALTALYSSTIIVIKSNDSIRDEILHTFSYISSSSSSSSSTTTTPPKSSSSASKSSTSTLPKVSSNTAPMTSSSSSISISSSRKSRSDSSMAFSVITNNTILKHDATDIRVGIISHQNVQFFRTIQHEIDTRDPYQRCLEYGFKFNPTKKIHRNVYFGALIADDTYELLDILSTETYNIFKGIVFVESNRTQNLTPRTFRHLHDTKNLQIMFNTSLLQIRTYIQEYNVLVKQQQQEDPKEGEKIKLDNEHAQRQEILKGWKELGMLPDDIGLLADTDEVFTRDFLRAVQTCDHIEFFTYNHQGSTATTTAIDDSNPDEFPGHNCQHQYAKLIATTQVFESSPECIVKDITLHHPDMILGHCIDYISTNHPIAPRDPIRPLVRAKGFGSDCYDWDGENNITDPFLYPTWSAGDFRRTCGGSMVKRKAKPGKHSVYTGYHFHNFFLNFNQTRFKYSTYGHSDADAGTKDIVDMGNDLRLMYNCIQNIDDAPDQAKKRIVGGYDATLSFRPIYFHDNDYRQRRHAHVQHMIDLDTQLIKSLQNKDIEVKQELETKTSSRSSRKSRSDSSMAFSVITNNTILKHDATDIRVGIISHQDVQFFRTIQNDIDTRDPYQRCLEYGFKYNPTKKIHRNIFFGALIADDTYELLDILSTETYNIFKGIVFVESNRTQNLTPRTFRHLHDTKNLQTMFNTSLLQIRTYIQEHNVLVKQQQQEDPKEGEKIKLDNEHAQRQEILKGWKELGMLPDDIGLLADTDEVFTRDFLRAVQTCDHIEFFTYNHQGSTTTTTAIDDSNPDEFPGHNCQHQYAKLIATTQVFESSPECIVKDITLHHPDMILGHCIDYISTNHPIAPRDPIRPLVRAKGFGSDCYDWDGENNITDPFLYPTWSAGDFRRTCGGSMVKRTAKPGKHSVYTGYHFHNFFLNFNQTRFKYSTYGHSDADAGTKNIVDMGNDLRLMYNCIQTIDDAPDQAKKRIVGGYNATLSFRPIYFHDNDYRQRRHAHVQHMIELDTQLIKSLQNKIEGTTESKITQKRK